MSVPQEDRSTYGRAFIQSRALLPRCYLDAAHDCSGFIQCDAAHACSGFIDRRLHAASSRGQRSERVRRRVRDHHDQGGGGWVPAKQICWHQTQGWVRRMADKRHCVTSHAKYAVQHSVMRREALAVHDTRLALGSDRAHIPTTRCADTKQVRCEH